MNRTKPAALKILAATFVLLCACPTVVAQSSLPGATGEAVVYDNTTTYLDTVVSFGNNVEFGDEIFLAPGVERFITDFKFQYFGTAGLNAGTGELFIRLNDGANVSTDPTLDILSPNTLLYRSGAFSLAAGFQTIEITDLAVEVPNSFTWSVRFDGMPAAEDAGLLVFNPPTVGLGVGDFWRLTDTGWNTFLIENGAVPANFAAQITAVPEPNTFLLALLGGAGLLGFLRSRRKA